MSRNTAFWQTFDPDTEPKTTDSKTNDTSTRTNNRSNVSKYKYHFNLRYEITKMLLKIKATVPVGGAALIQFIDAISINKRGFYAWRYNELKAVFDDCFQSDTVSEKQCWESVIMKWQNFVNPILVSAIDKCLFLIHKNIQLTQVYFPELLYNTQLRVQFSKLVKYTIRSENPELVASSSFKSYIQMQYLAIQQNATFWKSLQVATSALNPKSMHIIWSISDYTWTTNMDGRETGLPILPYGRKLHTNNLGKETRCPTSKPMFFTSL